MRRKDNFVWLPLHMVNLLHCPPLNRLNRFSADVEAEDVRSSAIMRTISPLTSTRAWLMKTQVPWTVMTNGLSEDEELASMYTKQKVSKC